MLLIIQYITFNYIAYFIILTTKSTIYKKMNKSGQTKCSTSESLLRYEAVWRTEQTLECNASIPGGIKAKGYVDCSALHQAQHVAVLVS